MKKNEFMTFDLGLASTLVVLGYELTGLDKLNPKKVGFKFKQEKNIDKVSEDYFKDKIKLPVLSLFNAQKNLKNFIYSNF